MPIQADEDEDVFAVPSQSKPPTQPAAALPVVDDADEDEDVIAVRSPAPAAEPEDPTAGMSFLQKADAAAARGVQGIGSALGLFARRTGLVRPEDDLAAAKNFLGRDLTTEEAQRVQTNGLEALVAPIQTAPNKGLTNRAANIVGGLAPAIPAMLAGGPVGGALAFGAQAAGGEQQASAEAGEDPEIQAARAKLAFAVNAPAALIPGSSLGLTKLPARMAAQALTGAALGGTTSAINDLAQQREINWDAVLSNAALMGGMGLAHQALQWEKTSGKKFNTPEEAVADLKSEYTRWWEEQMVKEEALRQSQSGAQALKQDLAEQQKATNPAASDPTLQRNKQFQAAYELFKQDLADRAAKSETTASAGQLTEQGGPDAIPERSTTPADVGQTPADRQTVGAREPGAGAQESADAQGRSVTTQALRTAGPAEVSSPAEAAASAAPPPKGLPPPNPQITPTPPPPPNPPTAKNPGPWRNAYLRIRRNITEDVPEAAKKVVANFSRVHRVDGVYNTPGGQEFLRRTYGALDQFGQQSGRWGNQFNKAVAALGREKSKAANGEYAALYESGAPAPTPAAKPLWDAMETASREEAADMVRNKVEISDPKVEGGKRLFVPMLERHVPRVLSKQVVRALARKKGALYEALAPFQKVEETGAHTTLKRELNTDNARSRRVAAIENARGEAFPDTVTLPSGEVVQVYNRNLLEIFPQYIENAARRTAIIEHFGDLREDGTWVNGQGGRAENVVNGLVAQVKETHPIAAKRMADTWADLNGNFSAEREAAMAESGLRTAVAVPDIVARSSMLSGSVLSQPFAAVQVSTREGARNFLRNAVSATTAKTLERAGKRIGLSKLMPETLAKIEEVRDLGGSSTDSLGHTFNTEDLVGAVGSAAKRTLAKTGLNAANVHINDIAGMAALDNLSQSIAALKTPKAAGIYNNLTGKSPAAVRLRLKQNYGFTDADIARMVDSGVARADKARAVQQASKVNLYRESALERAPWMSSQMARTFLPFTSILRQTGYVAKDAAAAAVKTGNLRPLVTLIVGGHIAGAAVGALKDFARGKPDEPPSDDVVDSLRKMAEYQLKAGAFGYGGVPVESLLYAIDSGQIPELEPTVVGWYRTLAEGAVDSWQAGSPKPMAKAVVKATPALTILDRAVEGPVWQERQAKALRRNAKEFKSEQPGSRPEDPTIDKFLKALQGGDTKAARALLPGLRRAKGGSQAIREALDRHEKYYLQGTKEAEEKWLKTLSADQRRAYDAMQQARKETARLGRTLVR